MMRMIVTGVKHGKSCVVKEIDYGAQGSDFSVEPALAAMVNELPPRPTGNSAFADLQVPPGKIVWQRVSFPPGGEFGFHVTDTIDCHTVVAGSMELLLDDGAHRLEVGDCAMVNGVDHGWRVGPEGCTSSLMLIGTPSPEAA
jgi:quercetin dioxygenase-like cupin family protein